MFRFRGEESIEYQYAPDDSLREQVERAAAACPAQAITIGRADYDVAREQRRPGRALAAVAPQRPSRANTSRAGVERIVLVGGALAGLNAAQELRAQGYTGRLTIVGDEPHAPYDRPPLSKAALTGWVTPDTTTLPVTRDLDAEWLLGVAAKRPVPDDHEVELADGRRLGFDRVLIATGPLALDVWNIA